MIPSKAPRAIRTPAVLAALALAASLATPRDAAAHAVLVASVPPSGGTVQAGPLAITLRYNSRIDRVRSKVTLVQPDSTAERLVVDAAGPADQLSAPATLAPGAYTLRWQVLATDGHITRGDVPFTVTPQAGTVTPQAGTVTPQAGAGTVTPQAGADATTPAPGAGKTPARTAGN